MEGESLCVGEREGRTSLQKLFCFCVARFCVLAMTSKGGRPEGWWQGGLVT